MSIFQGAGHVLWSSAACGVIMGQNCCSSEAAFQLLALASSHRNAKARVVAETILNTLPRGTPAAHFAD
ncbi:ANTAR domain-containing protein [Arthrobacter sp. B6]|uniref:ANTAR domain-containing protein n=1 Tax=Arthrobacter sp. B6 TaxID=1570137 RepID=UPI002F9092CA